jgi:ATP-dependent Lon protease
MSFDKKVLKMKQQTTKQQSTKQQVNKQESKYKKKQHSQSDDDSDYYSEISESDVSENIEDTEDEEYDEEYEEDDDEDCEEDEIDIQEYRKFLSKIFPSKYLDEKVKEGEKSYKRNENSRNINSKTSKKEEKEEKENVKEKEKSNINTRNSKKESSPSKIKNSKKYESDDDDDVKSEKKTSNKYIPKKSKKDDDSSSEDEEEVKNKGSKINMIFRIDEDDYDEEWTDYDENYETEDEDQSVSTDNSEEDEESENSDDVSTKHIKNSKNKTNSKIESSKNTKGENSKIESSKSSKNIKGEKIESSKNTKVESSKNTKIEKIETIKNRSNSINENIIKGDENIKLNVEDENVAEKELSTTLIVEDEESVLLQLKEMYEKNKNNTYLKSCIEDYENNIKLNNEKKQKKEKKHKDKNMRIFKHILYDKNTMNDYTFFEKMEVEEQKQIIKEMRSVNKFTRIETPYRVSVLKSKIPTNFKGEAIKKINSLKYMEPGTGEYYKIKNWVDAFMRIPFGVYKKLPVNIADGIDSCHEFMETAAETLENAVYGLNDAKMQIMQLLGQLVANPDAIGSAIAIHGPPGTGKTSLVKEGISKILNRPFAFIALGGATDSSFLEGHSYTYEGSTWGKIVQILIDSKCMNPVIYFDELDKISETPRGEEIAGILTHLTDTTQNSQFHDKYFADIDFDLSKCLFIFSYNDESKVNPILKDRMYRIQTKGYDKRQKNVISNNYLLPKIREQVLFKEEDIIISEDTIHYIIEKYCSREDGVRNLKRCLEIIYTKLNLFRLMKQDTKCKLFEDNNLSLKVEFPFVVSRDIVEKLIKQSNENVSLNMMYV